MLANDDIERVTDELVGKLVQEMKRVAEEMFDTTDKRAFPKNVVLASILWTRLGQKLSKTLDDIRHEHLLVLRSLAER